MAKRSNPFVEDFVPQSKVHFGVKQFNNNEERLQKVYEKTLHLLFKGAKKTAVSDSTNNSVIIPCKDKMKQLFIGLDGSLSHSGTVVEKESCTATLCTCGDTTDMICAYCERALCSRCEHHCMYCDKSYCTKCSLLGSEDSEVCVSCYCYG